MSAWPAYDPTVAREAAAAEQDDAWRADRLKGIAMVIADRALTPSAQHALIELLLDPVIDAMTPIDDDHLSWSRKLSRRLGLTERGARKALAELEANGLVKRERRTLEFLPDGWAERMRLKTDAPRFPTPPGLDPAEAHARRLERLRDFAVGQGLFTTAVSLQRTIGRVRGFEAPRRKRNTSAAAAWPPLETRATPAPQGEGCSNVPGLPPHPEEGAAGDRLEG